MYGAFSRETSLVPIMLTLLPEAHCEQWCSTLACSGFRANSAVIFRASSFKHGKEASACLAPAACVTDKIRPESRQLASPCCPSLQEPGGKGLCCSCDFWGGPWGSKWAADCGNGFFSRDGRTGKLVGSSPDTVVSMANSVAALGPCRAYMLCFLCSLGACSDSSLICILNISWRNLQFVNQASRYVRINEKVTSILSVRNASTKTSSFARQQARWDTTCMQCPMQQTHDLYILM